MLETRRSLSSNKLITARNTATSLFYSAPPPDLRKSPRRFEAGECCPQDSRPEDRFAKDTRIIKIFTLKDNR
ncbi:hypothetical protein BPAE_0274g00100 [Botrytis paeoniae]|uniref:Uncharacterized protein n=1 Tax=Botrytis paeoniae TaxID=278948 RepID=A0A4Z1FB05_9HELO|nr:hypothetical protein BPAE_0274g00100 [Botrytis paeoniae]